MEAIVIGATGLVGGHLTEILKNDQRFNKIHVFTRRELTHKHPKVVQHIIDFNNVESWQHLVKGNVLFSTLGTTLKKAGSKEAQYKIDHTYQFEFAKAAAKNGVNNYVLVSSADANPKAKIFYSRMKGELEEDVKKLPFKHIVIIKPGMLEGERNESRLAEKLALPLLKGISKLPFLSAIKPVHGKIVAHAMINGFFNADKKVSVYRLGDVFKLAGK